MAQLQLSPAVWLQTQALSSAGLLCLGVYFWQCYRLLSCSGVSSSATPWTVACQAPGSTEFSRQEYWSGLPFPTPGDLPDQGIKPKSLASPALAGRIFITAPSAKPSEVYSSVQSLSRVRLCDPMNCSTPGLPVHHHLPESTQTHVH